MAIEHVEVSTLIGIIDANDEAVRGVMQLWRERSRSSNSAVAGVTAIARTSGPRIAAAVDRVKHASTRPESVAVAIAGSDYFASMCSTAIGYANGTITETEASRTAHARQVWSDASDRWDAATGRAQLPLVGGLRHA